MTSPGVHIRRAGLADLDMAASLFDAYRQFYRQKTDIEGALRFIRERLIEKDSYILLAEYDGEPAGFVQLYPSYSSVRMERLMILNDLYVAETMRGQGIGRALLDAACEVGRQAGAVRLVLETERSNERAQNLYDNAGWRRSNHIHYGIDV